MSQNEIHQSVHLLPYFIYQGQKVIVDTGSPSSFGRIDEITIDGELHRLSSPLPSYLSTYIPNDVIAIIGMNIIKDFDLKIDTNTYETEFVKKLCDELPNSVNIANFMSVPTINVKIGEHNVNCLFDTGAHINYINSSMVKGLSALEKAKDFNPIIGEFETNIYNLNVVLNDINKILKFGNLPRLAETGAFGLGNVDGIIGLNLFEGKKVVLSIRRSKIFFG